MKKLTVAVCEAQDAYRERLAEYLMHKKSGKLEVYAFSREKLFFKEREQRSFDIVLFGRGFEKLREEKQADCLYLFLSETPEWEPEMEPAVFKYQCAGEILRSMFTCYLEVGEKDVRVSRGKKEIIGIYSPTRSRLQTPFAVTMAQVLSAEKRVLYVNLGEWAGFGDWFQEEYRRDLADLLYFISCHETPVQGLLESVVHTVNRMDYIPPMADAQLLSQTCSEDYRALLQLLVEKSDYEVVFLDFGIMVPGFFSLLEQCTHIYGVVDQGSMARSQCLQFEKSIARGGMEGLAERMEYVSFSLAEAQVTEWEPMLNQWLYGVLGDRARTARYRNSGAN